MTNLIQQQSDKQAELKSEITQRLAQFGLIFAVGISWALLPQKVYPYELLPALALMAGANGLGLYCLRRARPAVSAWVVAAGNNLVLLILMALFPTTWLPFAALPLMLVNALLVSNLAGLAFALIVGAAAVLLNQVGVRDYPLVGWLVVVGCGLVVNWLSVYTLSTAADWYRIAQNQSDQRLDETRQHRAELSRALKSLKLANELQRKTQNELILARKQADKARQMKEQFAANISHELRTPLNLILGFSKLMYLSPEIYGNLEWGSDLRHDIAQIYRSSRHLMEMIDDILDLSQFEMTGFSLVREPTPLYLFLKDAAETIGNLFRAGSVQFVVRLAEDLPILDIDRTRIRQVLVNLLTNAYRYTQAGFVELSAEVKEDQVLISVHDSGPGIAPEKLPFIFDEFFQADASLGRKSGGVGLGLTICRRFVEAHQGRIWVESQLEHGSSFTFALPCSGTAGSPQAEAVSEVVYSNLLPNAVLVEADPEIFNITRRQVGSYEWIQVKDIQELDPVVRQYHPRAVVVNLAPDQMEQVLHLPEVPMPVIACSLPGRMQREDEMSRLTLLRKPVDMEVLKRELEHYGDVRDLLVIDDDRGFVQLAERLVRATGKTVDVRWAYSGAEGISAMQEQHPDLVLLDLVMPDMNGMQVLERIQSDPDLQKIPVCLVTSGSYELESFSRTGHRIVIYQSGGIRPSKTFGYLKAVLNLIEPNESQTESEMVEPTENPQTKPGYPL
jgi:signal transduction histidine kinase